MGHVATYLVPPRGSLTLHRGGQNEKWPTNGLGGYITPATGQNQMWPKEWAGWLDKRFCLADTQHFRAVVEITSGTL